MKVVYYFVFIIYDPLNYKGFFIFTWKSLMSSKLFCGDIGFYSFFYYFLSDLLGVFLGDGGSTGGRGGGSSKSGYLIPFRASFNTIVS